MRTLARIDPSKFKAAIAATSGDQILLSFAFTALSYLALTGYDGLALRHLGIKVPYRLTALASFTSYAFSFTLGFPLVTGAAVRYWIYGPAGLSAGKIASLTVVAGITFWLGMGLVVGVGFLSASDPIADIDHFHPLANRSDRLGRHRRADRLSCLDHPHALAARVGCRQFQASGPKADPRANGAWRHRHLLGVGRALCAAAAG